MCAVSVSLLDLDGTIYKGRGQALIYDFPAFLTDQGLFDHQALKELDMHRGAYGDADHPLARNEYLTRISTTYFEGLVGQSVHAVEVAAHRFWEERFESSWYPHTAELIALLNEYTTTILVSGSPQEPLWYVKDRFSLSELYATSGCTEHGVYTGRYRREGEYATDKAKERLIRNLREELQFDPHTSFAFGDTESDIPMLRAVNPKNSYVRGARKALLVVAEKRGWNTLRYDVDIVGQVRTRILEVFPDGTG